MADSIDRFRGWYGFLSNFHTCEIVYQGVAFPSSENAYQAAKFPKWTWGAFTNCSAATSKKRSRMMKSWQRKDWHRVKVDIMRDLIAIKFTAGSKLAGWLLRTGDSLLVEGNSHGDRFWGKVDGVGENHLGELLMERRNILSEL